MDAILRKTNLKFDFEKDISVPIDERIFKNYDIDPKEYAIAFIAVAIAQLFQAKKVTYKYKTSGFYLDIFIEFPKIGILFIRNPASYTDAELETVKDICLALGIELYLVYLYDDQNLLYRWDARTIRQVINDEEKLDLLDQKTKDLMLMMLKTCRPLAARRFEDLYQEIDSQLCYRLGILLSLIPKRRCA